MSGAAFTVLIILKVVLCIVISLIKHRVRKVLLVMLRKLSLLIILARARVVVFVSKKGLIMKTILWKAVAEVLRILATSIIALCGLSATGCVAVPIF